jgi:hypothetical protein
MAASSFVRYLRREKNGGAKDGVHQEKEQGRNEEMKKMIMMM